MLEAHGHNIRFVFTDGEAPYNQNLRDWAAATGTPNITVAPGQSHMQQLLNDKVDLLFSVEYPWKIPCANLPFKTVNVHPSMLPHGRGPNPVSWSILKYPEHAGVTLHKLADEFDTGDIIHQESMVLTDDEYLQEYLARLEEKIPEMISHLCQQFDDLYETATAQDEGSYWPKLTLNDRKLNWHTDTADLKRIIRAFGDFGVVVVIETDILLVRDVQVLKYTSEHSPGTLFKEDEKNYYIAVQDGLCAVPKAGILERSKLAKKGV